MNYIRITNASFFDKDYNSTFARQKDYRFFNVGSLLSTLIPMYTDLLRQAIGVKVDETFQDLPLTKEVTMEIKTIFENQIDLTLPFKENNTPYHQRLEWKGEVHDLNLSIPSPKNRMIWDFYQIVQICDECLNQEKPMYLSIE